MPRFLTDTPFSPAEALETFTASAEGAGGIVSFSGHVRPVAGDVTVTGLYLQAHPTLTEKGIEQAGDDASRRWPLIDWTVIHRIGEMAPGDAIVFVATAAAHRRAAFEAADFLMDYLKTQAVFWKKELQGERWAWIEPRAEDYDDQARWRINDASVAL